MNRRDSIMNGSDSHSTAQSSAASDMVAVEFSQQSAVEEFDATAAALSRLSVLAESGNVDGGASPQLDRNSTYETSTPSLCPSPSKRSSEFFDHSAARTELKRLRRDARQTQAYGQSTGPFSQDFSLNSPREAMPAAAQLTGLGLVIDASPLARPESTIPTVVEDAVYPARRPINEDNMAMSMDAEHDVASMTQDLLPLLTRRRANSAPIMQSARWLAPSASRKHKDKLVSKLRATLNPDELYQKQKSSHQARRPPIAQHTLKELELSEIFKNAQLRHDIVHDPNLQFRPNTDGDRGAKKRQESDKYWDAIALDLDTIHTVPKKRLVKSRLSIMFEEMKNILLSLVPASETAQLQSTFDHELFVQSLHHGIFSASRFANYMSSLMKRHCAPMRDDAIDATVRMLETAQTSLQFVEALRSTFDVLEMMKLDVANHQLRSLRGLLLETSVEFEKSWFARKYTNKVLSAESGKTWYDSLRDATQVERKADYRAIFTGGLVSLLKSSSTSQIPSTFTFDQGRLTALKKDVRDFVYVNVILLLAKQVDKDATAADIAHFKSDLWIIVQSEKARSVDKWLAARRNIVLRLVSRKLGRDGNGHPMLPSQSELDFADSWLKTHMSVQSPIFKMLEARTINLLNTVAYNTLVPNTVNGHSTAPAVDYGIFDASRAEFQIISRRVNVIADFHWKVHGGNYIMWSKQ